MNVRKKLKLVHVNSWTYDLLNFLAINKKVIMNLSMIIFMKFMK